MDPQRCAAGMCEAWRRTSILPDGWSVSASTGFLTRTPTCWQLSSPSHCPMSYETWQSSKAGSSHTQPHRHRLQTHRLQTDSRQLLGNLARGRKLLQQLPPWLAEVGTAIGRLLTTSWWLAASGWIRQFLSCPTGTKGCWRLAYKVCCISEPLSFAS